MFLILRSLTKLFRKLTLPESCVRLSRHLKSLIYFYKYQTFRAVDSHCDKQKDYHIDNKKNMNPIFSWVKNHQELSEYLLSKRDQQGELIDLLKSGNGLSEPKYGSLDLK